MNTAKLGNVAWMRRLASMHGGLIRGPKSQFKKNEKKKKKRRERRKSRIHFAVAAKAFNVALLARSSRCTGVVGRSRNIVVTGGFGC